MSKPCRTPTYISWEGMKNRCDCPTAGNYKYYGAQGISYDPRWADFFVFLSDMGERPEGTSLDRIDFNADYSKENCRWVSAKEQCNNRSTCLVVEFNGRKRTVTEWAEELSVSRGLIYNRIACGWCPEKALTTPVRKQTRKAA